LIDWLIDWLYGCVDIACAGEVVQHLRDVRGVRDDSRPSQLRLVWRPLFHQTRLHVSHVVKQQLSSRHTLCTSTVCSLTCFEWTMCVFWSLEPAASVHRVTSPQLHSHDILWTSPSLWCLWANTTGIQTQPFLTAVLIKIFCGAA